MNRRRIALLAALLLVLASLPACEFLKDEFVTIDQAPPTLERLQQERSSG